MTEIQAPPVTFGQVLGETARDVRRLADGLFAGEGTSFESWATLNTIARRGSSTPVDELQSELAVALVVDVATIGRLLNGLEQSGFARVTDAGEVELTPDGRARHAHLAGLGRRLSADLLAQLDPDDVETTIRVLRQVQQRAPLLSR